jgi:hypothetical protein
MFSTTNLLPGFCIVTQSSYGSILYGSELTYCPSMSTQVNLCFNFNTARSLSYLILYKIKDLIYGTGRSSNIISRAVQIFPL